MLAIFKNIKLLVGVGVVLLVLATGFGVYYHGKNVEALSNEVSSLEAKNESLEADLESHRIASEIIREESEKYQREQKQRLNNYKELVSELQELKENDKDSRDYLNNSIPNGVRTVRERARCISLPYLCGEAGRDEDSKD